MVIKTIADSIKDGKHFKDYVTGTYNIDREHIAPKEKQEMAYNVLNAKALFQKLITNRMLIPTNEYSRIQELRQYATGTQSEAKYIEQFSEHIQSQSNKNPVSLNNKNHNAQRNGLGHINTQIISIANKIMSRYYSLFSEYEEDIFIDNIDEDSGAEKEREKYKAYVKAQYGDWMTQKERNAGIPVDENAFMLPADVTKDELQLFFESGGFKLNYARVAEKILRHIENISQWDKRLKKKLVFDLVALGIIAGRTYWDDQDMEERQEYIDMQNFFIQHSQEQDFYDAEYAGYLKLEKVSKLIARGFKKDELKDVAYDYAGWFGNPTQEQFIARENANNESGDWYFSYLVPVMHCEWIDTDVKKSKKATNTYGSVRYLDVDFDYNKPDNENRKLVETHIRKTYGCSWVVGTELAYDYGLIDNQHRSNNKKPSLSFFCENLNPIHGVFEFNSIVTQIIPFLDNLQNSWLRYQDLFSRMIRSGYMINMRLLQNLDLGGDKLDSMEAFKMFPRKGLLPYMDTMAGQVYRGGDVVPIHQIEGGIGRAAEETLQAIKLNIDFISEITGIAPVDLGAVPDPNQPVTATQMQSVGSSNVNRPMIDTLFLLKRSLAEASIKRLVIRLRNSEEARSRYAMIVGRRDVEILAQSSKEGRQYGIYTETRPSAEEKQALIAAAQEAIKRGRDGEATIGVGQFTYIIERLQGGGSYKELRMMLEFVERKAEDRRHQRTMQVQGQQNQAQAQRDQQAHQREIEKTMLGIRGDLAKEAMQQKTKQGDVNVDYIKSLLEATREEEQQEREQALAQSQ